MLNPIEKVLLSLASVVLSSRYTRNLFVLYAMGLHFIVLSVLVSWTTDGGDSMQQVTAPSFHG